MANLPKTKEKKKYTPPRLIRYGFVQELTAGGPEIDGGVKSGEFDFDAEDE